MSKLGDALNATSKTENGAIQYATSTSRCLDFFQMAGSVRKSKISGDDVRKAWQLAYSEDGELALRALLWAYDARGGAGCRDVMTACLPLILLRHDHSQGSSILRAIPTLGRYDMLSDLLEADDLPVDFAKEVMTILANALGDESTAALCAKWLPRKGKAANRIRGWLKLKPADYRHMLAKYKTTETLMSNNQWSKIEYAHVPSVCMARSRKAFQRHDAVRFDKFNERVISGDETVKATVVYPHDVVRSIMSVGGWHFDISTVESERKAAQAQWISLPDYFEGTNRSIFPLVDVSGSMSTSVSGSIQAIHVAVSLGVYCAEHQRGAFKDECLCFSGRPRMAHLKGDIANRVQQLLDTPDECNTDLGKAIRTIVDAARTHRMTQEDLPDVILILSDMQFDEMSWHSNYHGLTPNAYIQKTFADAGYKAPLVVYWNLASRKTDGTPATANDKGVAMVSGFSPSVLKAVLKGADLTTATDPAQVMLETLLVDRYDLSKY